MTLNCFFSLLPKCSLQSTINDIKVPKLLAEIDLAVNKIHGIERN